MNPFRDLRTPLTGISGSISAVLDNGEYLAPEQQRELLEGARDDADWLCRMVENPAEPKYIFTEVGVGYRMVEGD